MPKTLYILFFLNLIAFQLLSQCEERYVGRYFNNIQIFRDVVYTKDAPTLIGATITTETTINKDLVMDIFMPPVTDTVTNRPVVILAHGGGFINVAFMGGTVLVGTMDNEDVQALADSLAHWGFVTASIEYRLGFNIASPSSLKRAVWRGAQDMSAAIRFFRKNAAWFKVDPNRIFSGGSSAGAFCAIHSAFVDDSERLPESYQLVPILKKDLGALHSRPVVELSSFNPFVGSSVLGNDVDSIPQGIAAYWGAIADFSWFSGTNKAPMIMFHGTEDLIVDYKCQKPFSNVVLTAPETCGSYIMDSILTSLNEPHEVHFGIGQGHEYWGALNGDWTTTGPNAYWPDIIQKTADYFYDIMRPGTPSIIGPDTVLPTTNYTYTIANPLPNHNYCWEVTGGVLVSPSITGTTVDVQFYNTTTQGFVTAKAIDAADVASEKGVILSTVTANVAVNRISSLFTAFEIYPNPANEAFKIEINSRQKISGKLQLINTLGQIVLIQEINLEEGVNLEKVDVSQLPKGSYLVVVRNEKKSIAKYLLIH